MGGGADGARERGRSERRRRQGLRAPAPRSGREGKVRETGRRERMDESRRFVAEVRSQEGNNDHGKPLHAKAAPTDHSQWLGDPTAAAGG